RPIFLHFPLHDALPISLGGTRLGDRHPQECRHPENHCSHRTSSLILFVGLRFPSPIKLVSARGDVNSDASVGRPRGFYGSDRERSEEQTSELQSRENLV